MSDYLTLPKVNSGIAEALAALAAVERHRGRESAPAAFTCTERVAQRVADHGLLLPRLADPLVRTPGPASGADVRVTVPSAAAVTVLGKFSRTGRLKARAYLPGTQPLTVKLWRSGTGDEEPGAREREARTVVCAIPDYRALPVVDSGRIDNVEYVCEPLVYGRHPYAPAARLAAAHDLVPALARAYLTAGVEDRPLSAGYERRGWRRHLKTVLADPTLPWDAAFGGPRKLRQRLRRLVNADRALPWAHGHGDIVVTNIIRTEDGSHVLTDWEMARLMPVAFDLGKLLFISGDPGAVESSAREALRPFDGDGRRRYRWHEQLALGLAWHIAMNAARRERAVTAGRLDRFEAEHAARLRWLVDLLY